MTTKFTGVGNGSGAASGSAITPTKAPVAAPDPRQMPDGQSEFVRMGDLRRLFGITRAAGYQLAKAGKIRTVSLRQRGAVRGVRLVSVPSVRAYLNALLGRQTDGEGFGHE